MYELMIIIKVICTIFALIGVLSCCVSNSTKIGSKTIIAAPLWFAIFCWLVFGVKL